MKIYITFVLSFFILLCIHAGRVTITLFALNLGASPFTIGVLAAMLTVIPTLLSWNIGKFCDRFGSRLPLLFCTVSGALGMLAPFIKPGIFALYITSVMCGLMLALSIVPLQNLIGLQSGPKESAKNFSNYSVVVSFAGFTGPLLAGFLIDHVGPRVTCISLVSIMLVPVAILIISGGIMQGGMRTHNAKPKESIRELISVSGLWRVILSSSLVVTGIDLFLVYIPVYGHGIELSASTIGFILATYSLASFVVRFFLPSLIKRLNPEGVLSLSFLLGSASFLMFPFFKSAIPLFSIAFFFGLGMGCGMPITLMMTFSSSAQGRSGEAMGLRVTAYNLARSIGQVFFGSIGSAIGVFWVFWASAIMLASGLAVNFSRVKRN